MSERDEPMMPGLGRPMTARERLEWELYGRLPLIEELTDPPYPTDPPEIDPPKPAQEPENESESD